MKDNPGAAVGPYYRSFFFGAQHPYGRMPDEASYRRIDRQAIADYHRRLYTGRNLIVVVAGDFDPAMAQRRVGEVFGAAPVGEAWKWVEDRSPAAALGPRLLLVDKPDATQIYFILARPGVRRTAPERVTLALVNTLIGGRFTSMLNDELRVNSGLTYGARSQVENARLTGAIFVSTYTRTDSTARAIDLALDVMRRIREKGLTAEQLASAKAYVKGTFAPNRLQTADQIAAVLGEMELFGLGRDETDSFFARVDAVTLDQANEVARRYYGPDNLAFVLVGSAAKIRESVAKYAPKMTERSVTEAGWAGM
jgi:predicted Zn-dependent peptidase